MAAWLQAFFDDEAHFGIRGRIRVRSVNRRGLRQAATMLRRFTRCQLTPRYGLYKDGSCYLVVPASERQGFLRRVGAVRLTLLSRRRT